MQSQGEHAKVLERAWNQTHNLLAVRQHGDLCYHVSRGGSKDAEKMCKKRIE